MDRITANGSALMVQAGDTAAFWLGQAVRSIDKLLGKGYASRNPDIVAAFMQAASVDQFTSTIGSIIQDSVEEICGRLDNS